MITTHKHVLYNENKEQLKHVSISLRVFLIVWRGPVSFSISGSRRGFFKCEFLIGWNNFFLLLITNTQQAEHLLVLACVSVSLLKFITRLNWNVSVWNVWIPCWNFWQETWSHQYIADIFSCYAHIYRNDTDYISKYWTLLYAELKYIICFYRVFVI